MSAPIFLHIDQQILNVNEIKWVGVKDMGITQKVCIEFIPGGQTTLDSNFRISDFRIALDEAISKAAPF